MALRLRPPSMQTQELALAGALALIAVASLALRTDALDIGYWIDEAISVGIASHDLSDIPRTLREDGSPPLYYLLLHGWMDVVGSGEAATRALSLVFAFLAVPAAWWAGRAVFGGRAAWLAAVGAAGCPFLTHYAQETRMYSLVALLSIVASAAFVLAFVHGRRRHLVTLVLALALVLYTHNWGLFLVAGMSVAWLGLWHSGKVRPRDGWLVIGTVALLYAPWVPSLISQALHTGAPWAERPSPAHLLGVPGRLFGDFAVPLLAFPLARALREPSERRETILVLGLVAGAAVMLAWLLSQAQPLWASRYLAVVFGPLLLVLAGGLARGGRWTAAALAGVALIWLLSGPPDVKSNARTVADKVAPTLQVGDFVVCTQPEQVPVLDRYLPPGLLYFTPTGFVPDPRVADWRDTVARLRAARVENDLDPVVAAMVPGQRLLLVTPVVERRPSQAPYSRVVRMRSRQWRAALRADPRLRPIAAAPASTFPRRPAAVRAEVFVRVSGRA